MGDRTTRLLQVCRRLASDFPTESVALWRRLVWQMLGRVSPVVLVEHDGMRFFMPTQDQVIGRRFFAYPTVPEQDIVTAFAALHAVPSIELPPGTTVVEIGANIGTHTVEMIQRYGIGRVVAIEPDPGNVSLLRHNVLVNDVGEEVDVLPIGLSSTQGTMELERSATNHGDHRLRVSEVAADDPEAARETVTVEVSSFDHLVETGRVDLSAVGLVWMDTQGHEAYVLDGATTLLGSSIPIVTEYWPYALRRADGYERFHELVEKYYPYAVDLRPPSGGPPRVVATSALRDLEAEYAACGLDGDRAGGTDLILAPGIDPDLVLPSGSQP